MEKNPGGQKTRGRGDFVKFYLALPKMRVAPQMPPQIPRPGAATDPKLSIAGARKARSLTLYGSKGSELGSKGSELSIIWVERLGAIAVYINGVHLLTTVV